MKRLVCWLFGHRWTMTWYGPNGVAENRGPCVRCDFGRVSPNNKLVNCDLKPWKDRTP